MYINRLKSLIYRLNVFIRRISHHNNIWSTHIDNNNIRVRIFSRFINTLSMHMYIYVHNTMFNNKSYKNPVFWYGY